MDEVLERIVACILCSTFFCLYSMKMVGAMQQSAYKNSIFYKWLTKKDNMQFNRLCVFALCLALTSCMTVLTFSFLGERGALLISAVVFCGLMIVYLAADAKYALKVALKPTPRVKRLVAVFALLVACVAYALIELLAFISALSLSKLYHYIAYVPFSIMPILLPFLCMTANGICAPFETARNNKFVKRAGQVLNETNIIRVGIVGSYGKTSVKNILKTLLEEKYSVVATPESYNTPMGIAKTILSESLDDKQVFIAEMGARKAGDIRELSDLLKPNFAIFTGVCQQHIATFETLEKVFEEKSTILNSGAVCVCGDALRENIAGAQESYAQDKILFAGKECVRNLQMYPTKTTFTLCLGDEKIAVETPLLSAIAAENIALAATLAYTCFGLTAEEIKRGTAKLQPIPHRLQLLESGGVYILDDGYNANIKGAKEAIAALQRFEKGKIVVTPGLVECGVLEETLNAELGEVLARAELDKVILVGHTLVGAVKNGYIGAGGAEEKVVIVSTLTEAQEQLKGLLTEGDCVLFLNDLPDVYT